MFVCLCLFVDLFVCFQFTKIHNLNYFLVIILASIIKSFVHWIPSSTTRFIRNQPCPSYGNTMSLLSVLTHRLTISQLFTTPILPFDFLLVSFAFFISIFYLLLSPFLSSFLLPFLHQSFYLFCSTLSSHSFLFLFLFNLFSCFLILFSFLHNFNYSYIINNCI